MTFKQIRISKGLMPSYVKEELTKRGIEMSDWQFADRERHPKKYLPCEIKALCDIYNVDINEVEF